MKNRLRSKSTALEVTRQINTTPTLKKIPPVPINDYFFGLLACAFFCFRLVVSITHTLKISDEKTLINTLKRSKSLSTCSTKILRFCLE